jgi:hypothetical protein
MDDPIAVSRQRTVDDVASLAALAGCGGEMKKKRVRRGQGFDVNRYFSVLPHLSMEPGYVLDYAYSDRPHIYARRVDAERCLVPEKVWDLGGKRTEAEHWLAYSHGAFGYHHHIYVDDTEEGFFQLVLLVIMGGQFYLVWHGAYNDSTIVCTHGALDSLLSDDEGSLSARFARVSREARAFNLAPCVKIGEDEVVVRVVLFTGWGGLQRWSYVIRRAFPHRILSRKVQTLVEYDCGVWF